MKARKLASIVARLRPWARAPAIAISIVAIWLACTFVAAVRAHAHEFGLPLEDGYI